MAFVITVLKYLGCKYINTFGFVFFFFAFLTVSFVSWPCGSCYLDSVSEYARLVAAPYFNVTPLSCSCEALLLCAMFDKSLCKECGQTPAPLKPLRARGHGNTVCLWGLRILGNANCYISHHQACVTVPFHCPLCPLYWEICNIMRIHNGDLIWGEVQELKLRKWELTEQSRCVSRKKPIPSCNPICFYFHYLPLNDNTQ